MNAIIKDRLGAHRFVINRFTKADKKAMEKFIREKRELKKKIKKRQSSYSIKKRLTLLA